MRFFNKSLGTYESHAWLISDLKGNGLGIYIPNNENSQIFYFDKKKKLLKSPEPKE
jgi:hypothetical protein